VNIQSVSQYNENRKLVKANFYFSKRLHGKQKGHTWVMENVADVAESCSLFF